MDLQNKNIPLLHDGDYYEVVINAQGQVVEIWRYRGNQRIKPEFCLLEWLDEILQDRIHDRIIRYL